MSDDTQSQRLGEQVLRGSEAAARALAREGAVPDFAPIRKALEGQLASLNAMPKIDYGRLLRTTGVNRKLSSMPLRRPASSDDIARLETAVVSVAEAALAIVVAVESSSKRSERIGRWVMWLTVALVVLTAVLVGHEQGWF